MRERERSAGTESCKLIVVVIVEKEVSKTMKSSELMVLATS